MFEQYFQEVHNFYGRKIRELGPYFTYEEFSALEIHPAIGEYISAEIDFVIFEDRQKILKNSIFDYSSEKVTEYFSLVNGELKKEKKFSAKYFSDLVLKAAAFNVNYLSRPNWALKKLMFGSETVRSSAEIDIILDHLYYYSYLKKILKSYLNRKNIVSLERDEFDKLLKKIDHLGISSNLKNILEMAVTGIAEFYNIGSYDKSIVPVDAVAMFLKEKGLNDFLEAVKIRLGKSSDKTRPISFFIEIFHSDPDSLLLPFDEEPEEISDDETPDQKEKAAEELLTDEELLPALDEELKEQKEEDKTIRELPEHITDDEITEETEESAEEISEEPEPEPAEADEATESELQEAESVTPEEPFASGENESDDNEPDDDSEDQEFEILEIEDEEPEIKEPEDQPEPESELPEENESDMEETEEAEPESGLEEKEEEIEEETHPEDDIVMPDDLELVIAGEEDYEADTDSEEGQTPGNELPEEDKIVEEEDDSGIIFPMSEHIHEEAEEEPGPADEEQIPEPDISALIEHKKMPKIIQVIFDYDMEDFADTIDAIADCKTGGERMAILEKVFNRNNVKRNSREAQSFIEIINEFF